MKQGLSALRIALIGYGRMGKMIERIALERGHSIVLRITQEDAERWTREQWQSVDVAIEFTHPESAEENCRRCLELNIPVVSGTTGWTEGVERLASTIQAQGTGTLFWASNFSIGVYLFDTITRQVARLMQQTPSYKPSLTETHHIHKLDAPSGTAITLAETLISETATLQDWTLIDDKDRDNRPPHTLPIRSIREGEVAGIHSIEYRSEVDRITLTHEAFGREGFALGAVLAAEYASRHTGYLGMQDLFGNKPDEIQ